MEINVYRTMKDERGLPELVKENGFEWDGNRADDPEAVCDMMDQMFQIDRRTEEYMYEVCFDTKMRPLGIFEISHGTIDSTMASPREVFQKALMCGAACIALVHNHPSGDCSPSKDDMASHDQMDKAGKMIGIRLVDSIIIGEGVYSYRRDGAV